MALAEEAGTPTGAHFVADSGAGWADGMLSPAQASAQDFLASLGPDPHGLSQETPSLLQLCNAHGPPPALVFSCQMGVGRTNLGMVLGTLILLHRSGITSQPE